MIRARSTCGGFGRHVEGNGQDRVDLTGGPAFCAVFFNASSIHDRQSSAMSVSPYKSSSRVMVTRFAQRAQPRSPGESILRLRLMPQSSKRGSHPEPGGPWRGTVLNRTEMSKCYRPIVMRGRILSAFFANILSADKLRLLAKSPGRHLVRAVSIRGGLFGRET